MRKQNISRLLIGAATLTLATMVANGEAKASEYTTHQQHAPQQQAHQNDHKDVQRAYYHLIHLKGIDEAQRSRFLQQLHDNPTKETAQNVFSESTKDVNNPERRLAQRNAYFSVVNNPDISSADRERYIKKIIENPDHSQQIWIESNSVPSQNKDNSATEEELQKLISIDQPINNANHHVVPNVVPNNVKNKHTLSDTNVGKADTTSYKTPDNGHKPSAQDLKAKQEEQHVVQKAFQFLLQLKGLDEKQRSEFLKQLHENPTKETAQNVFSEASKDVANPERRVAQRKAYINLLENNKLPIGDLERLVKELHKNPDHAQQIWIESHRLSNANTKSKVSEHEFNRLVKPTQKDFDRRDDFLKSNELKALQGSNSGNTASVDEFRRFTKDSVIDLENNKQKLDYLLSSNKDNTVSAEQFRNIHLPNISVPSEKGSLEYLTNSNRDNTLTDDQLPNIINSFPIIPVAQDATIQPRAKASHKRHAHKSSHVKERGITYPLYENFGTQIKERGITYPLFENTKAQKKFIEKLLGPNGTKNLTVEELDKLFPPIPVAKEAAKKNVAHSKTKTTKRTQKTKHQYQEAITYPLDVESNEDVLKRLLGSKSLNNLAITQLKSLYPTIPASKEAAQKKGNHQYQEAIAYPLYEDNVVRKALIDELVGPNGTKNISLEKLEKLFPAIPVAKDKASHKQHAHKSSHVKERGTTYPLYEHSDAQKKFIEELLGPNGTNNLTLEQLEKLFPAIPVTKDNASHKQQAHKSSHVKERGTTYPLYEHSDAQKKFIEELLGPNGTKNLTLEQLEKLFPAIPVTKEAMEARQNDRIASANKALVALNKDYSVNSHRFAQREVNKAPHHVQAQLQKQLDGILTTHREKAEKERLQKPETNKTSNKASTSKTDTQTKTTQSKATQTTQSEQQTTTSSYYKSLKNYFTQGYHNVAQSHQGFKAKYEQAKYYFNTYFKHKSTIDKLVLAALGNGSKTHIKPLDIKPNGNVFYNTYVQARNYATEALNTGKVLYALYQNPKTVKTAIAAADTVSSFSHSLSNFFASIMK
ncbi:B domain-containing protein [Staphylococcus agnetis]|uniref:B domain-containing protein n=1 Tax=Staphylococcus agnetis TaxID=985762 RepID=UPI001FB2FC0A|nr:B domain-containing protein [Staphylococcus agnetis]UOC13150.1 B domain-containing protein [Staphylococcus agnetis]